MSQNKMPIKLKIKKKQTLTSGNANVSVWYGEEDCQTRYKTSGKPCRNQAYYLDNGKYLCGVHAKKATRVELPKNPKEKEIKQKQLKDRQSLVDAQSAKNKAIGKKGDVICSKLRMMKPPPHVDGYLKVFPNYKHDNRQDGFGCKALSPKDMGPIDHGQPGLPVAKNLENFHQGNKVFTCELDKDGNPSELFYSNRLKFYTDIEPHRHKYKGDKKNYNCPEYSVHLNKNGKEIRYTYVESRQFYCKHYQKIAEQSKEYKELVKMRDNGVNLQIIGYDGFNVTDSLDVHYNDPSRPFGHELVLYTMLVVDNPSEYPWNKV